MKVPALRKAVEADDCFYFQHAKEMAHSDDLDLATDPPPELVVEIDTTNESTNKFDIYASLGISEIWRYNGNRVAILALQYGSYTEVEFSVSFPFLNAERIDEFVKQTEALGPRVARKMLRERERDNKP
jgi:Uma2 family endonuclease